MKRYLLYTTPTCKYCSHATLLLESYRIEFKKIIINDDATRQDALNFGIMSVPALVVQEDNKDYELYVGLEEIKRLAEEAN